MPEDVGHFARMLGLEVPQVSDNGSRILDPVSGRTISELAIEREHTEPVIQRLDRDGGHFFAVDAGRTVRSLQEMSEWRITVITCAIDSHAEAV